MNFAYSHILWLLLVIPPLLVVFFWWSLRKKQALMTKFIQARLLPDLTVGLSPARQKFRMACVVAAVVMLIVTLARPQWGYHYEEVHQRGLDIVVAIDTSKSMLATDVQPDRLSRAKLAALDLMQQAKSDRLGLVAFAGEAFLQCPLTSDDSVFRQCVEALDVNSISRGGTALSEAINTALSAFKEKDNFKVLVLFTDGEDNDDGALAAAQAAAKEGLRIYTVGIGTPDGELLRITDNKGRTDYIRDEQGNVVKSRLNEDLLKQIAGETEGGFYLPLGAKTVDVLYEKGLSQLPKTDQATRLVRQYHEQFHWPLGLAVVLLLVEMLLPERRKSRRRTSKRQAQQTGADTSATTVMAASVALILLIVLPASASPSSALNEYNAGEYDQALKEYQRVLQKKKDDPRLNYNAGAAAYRESKFDEAGKYFNNSISAENVKLQERGYYNLGNVLYRVGENLQDKDKKKAAWQTALTNYDRTLKLNAADEDARFNYEFVKRKLEELEQEQQQQDQQQGGDGDKDQEKQDQQQGQGDQKQDQQQQGKDDQQSQQKPEQGKDQDSQSGQKQDEQKDQQPQPSPGEQKGKQDEPKEGQGQQGQPGEPKAMTPQEAQRMLEGQEGDEQFLQFKQGEPRETQGRPFKDW